MTPSRSSVTVALGSAGLPRSGSAASLTSYWTNPGLHAGRGVWFADHSCAGLRIPSSAPDSGNHSIAPSPSVSTASASPDTHAPPVVYAGVAGGSSARVSSATARPQPRVARAHAASSARWPSPAPVLHGELPMYAPAATD